MAPSSIVLYPFPTIGHLISMVELAKLILTHHPSFSITLLITTGPPPFSSTFTTSYIHQVSSTFSSISFYYFPPPPTTTLPHLPVEELFFHLTTLNNSHLQTALQDITSTNTTIKAFIIDFFCNPAFQVSHDLLRIPTYYYYSTSAFGLSFLLHLPTLHHQLPSTTSIKDLDRDIEGVPGIPPFPPLDSPGPTLDRTTATYDHFLRLSLNMARSAGIIVNTFEMLEDMAIQALISSATTPELHCIGPLIGPRGADIGPTECECLAWLDSQPKRSVVFLCFGSMGRFSKAQLDEIAVGLERSGCRFLWVVRSPGPPGENVEADLETWLPEGFVARTKGRGMVVKSWAPQKEILSHGSVGGFVTHCGWNSVLETVVLGGVPMIGWPLYAEQRFNRMILVKEISVALDLEISVDGFVKAEEVERRVRELMDGKSVSGRKVRERAAELRDGAAAALSDGGSSRCALHRLVESWMAQ